MRARRLLSTFRVLAVTLGCLLLTPAVRSVHADLLSGSSARFDTGLDTADPIKANSGTYVRTIPLLLLRGPLPLRWTLHHRSDGVPLPHRLGTGSKWQHSIFPQLDRRLPDLIQIDSIHPDETLTFFREDDVWVGQGVLGTDPTIPYVLIETLGAFFLQDPVEERVYVFDKTQGNRICCVADRRGNRWRYVYSTRPSLPDSITDDAGRTLSLDYDEPFSPTQSLLVRATDQADREIRFTYASEGALTFLESVTDTRGMETTFTYDRGFVRQSLVRETRPEGNAPVTQEYDSRTLARVPQHRVVTQTDADGHETTYTYDEDANRVTETRPDATTVVFEHFRNDGPPRSFTDEAGNTITYGETATNRTASVTDRRGGTTTVTYHAASGKPESFRDALGNVTRWTYSSTTQSIARPDAPSDTVELTFHDLTRIDHPDGTSRSYAYDDVGNLVRVTDEVGAESTYTYDAAGNVLTVTNPTGGVVTFTYDANGMRATATDDDESTGITRYTYDAALRLTGIHHPDDSTITYTYDPSDALVSIRDENRADTRLAYDDNGNLVRVEDAERRVVTARRDGMDRAVGIGDGRGELVIDYDDRGRPSRVTDATGVRIDVGRDDRGPASSVTLGGSTFRYEIDDDLFPLRTTSPLGGTRSVVRNLAGLVDSITDAEGGTTAFVRDGRHREVLRTDPTGLAVRREYDGRGALVKQTLPLVGDVSYAYDASGRLVRMTDRIGGACIAERTGNGRILRFTEADGVVTRFAYDERGRVTTQTRGDGSVVATTYDAASNVTSRSHAGDTLTFTYDGLGRVRTAQNVEIVRSARGLVERSVSNGRSYSATYDAAGRLRTLTYASGLVVTYTYDPVTGLVQGVSDDVSGATYALTRDADLRIVGVSRSGGATTTRVLDRAGRVTRITHGDLAEFTYEYDAAGRLRATTEDAPLTSADAIDVSPLSLAYDTGSRFTTGPHAYDVNGDLVRTADGELAWSPLRGLTRIGATRVEVDGLGGLTAVVDPAAGRIEYDQGRFGSRPRVLSVRTVPPPGKDPEERVAPALADVVFLPGAGGLLTPIYAVDQDLSDPAQAALRWLYLDASGDLRLVGDDAGGIVGSYAYSLGGALSVTGTDVGLPFTFDAAGGSIRLPSIDLYLAEGVAASRTGGWYDARTERFLSRRPICGLDGGFDIASLPRSTPQIGGLLQPEAEGPFRKGGVTLGIWSSTGRRRISFGRSRLLSGRRGDFGRIVAVSRLAFPLIEEVIPAAETEPGRPPSALAIAAALRAGGFAFGTRGVALPAGAVAADFRSILDARKPVVRVVPDSFRSRTDPAPDVSDAIVTVLVGMRTLAPAPDPTAYDEPPFLDEFPFLAAPHEGRPDSPRSPSPPSPENALTESSR